MFIRNLICCAIALPMFVALPAAAAPTTTFVECFDSLDKHNISPIIYRISLGSWQTWNKSLFLFEENACDGYSNVKTPKCVVNISDQAYEWVKTGRYEYRGSRFDEFRDLRVVIRISRLDGSYSYSFSYHGYIDRGRGGPDFDSGNVHSASTGLCTKTSDPSLRPRPRPIL